MLFLTLTHVSRTGTGDGSTTTFTVTSGTTVNKCISFHKWCSSRFYNRLYNFRYNFNIWYSVRGNFR